MNGHQKGSSYEATGNRIADVAAKEAASEDEIGFLKLTPNIPKISLIPKFSKEIKKLQEVGASRDEKGRWTLPDGREMISQPIMRELMNMLHRGSHWGPQVMCDALLKIYECISIYTIAKLPHLGRATDLPTIETKDQFLREYVLAMSSNLSSLKLKGILTQTPPPEFFAHCFQPRDLVLVKSWKED